MPDTPSATLPHQDVVTCRIATGDNATELDTTVNVLSILIHKEVNKIPFARIRFRDGEVATGDFPLADGATLVPGVRIRISLGYDADDTVLFEGIITTLTEKISAVSSEMIIEARDPAVKMTITQNNHHYNDITDSDLAGQLIENYGLTADVETTRIPNRDLVQFNTTDWDLLVSRMDRLGMITLTDGGKVTVKTPDLAKDPVLELQYGNNLLDFDATIDARHQITNVRVSSWNPQTQQVDSTDADDDSGGGGNLSAETLAKVLEVESLDLRSAANLGEAERQAIGNARKMKNVLAKIRGRARFFGHPGIHPGDLVNLKNVGDRFNGPVFVGAVEHVYAEGGWTTETTLGLSPEWFSAKATLPATPSGSTVTPPAGSVTGNGATGLISLVEGLQLGIVIDIRDPENEFRVKIRLPAVNGEEEGIWARVSTLDAGLKRGTYFRPETGDEVVVGFINNDPSFPVILGMMHSSALPAPITPAEDNNEKGYLSRDGLKMFFNDGDRSVNIETPSGKKITLSENAGTIEVADENGNSLRMEASGVTLKSGNDLIIEARGNLSLKANSVSASGNTDLALEAVSVSVKGSGTTEINGAIVKIN